MIFIELGLVSRGARLGAATSATYYRPDSQLWDGAAITPGGRGRSPAHPVVPCFPLFVTRHCAGGCYYRFQASPARAHCTARQPCGNFCPVETPRTQRGCSALPRPARGPSRTPYGGEGIWARAGQAAPAPWHAARGAEARGSRPPERGDTRRGASPPPDPLLHNCSIPCFNWSPRKHVFNRDVPAEDRLSLRTPVPHQS
jgi:hypothetical protein